MATIGLDPHALGIRLCRPCIRQALGYGKLPGERRGVVTYLADMFCYPCLRVGPARSGAPGETRTPDPLVRSQMLYPAELRARAAILPKFAGGAADVGYPIAAHGTKFDGARNEAWLPG